jgi:pentatricopeptide repeat protein
MCLLVATICTNSRWLRYRLHDSNTRRPPSNHLKHNTLATFFLLRHLHDLRHPSMFRATSQTRPGLYAVTHVAGGLSLGGLCLLAEERRRRVAIAQKIVENGRKLQAYKSYGAVAAVAEFDLGRHWDGAEEAEHAKHIQDEPRARSLTNFEWRSRGRSHRRLPTAPHKSNAQDADEAVAGSALATTESASTTHTSTPAHADRHASTTSSPRRLEGLRRSLIQRPASDARLAIEREVKAKRTTLPSYTRERSLIYQNVIAGRVTECLASEDTKLRAAGFHELSVYFREPHNDLGKEMRGAVRLAYRAPAEELRSQMASKIRRQVNASIALSRVAASETKREVAGEPAFSRSSTGIDPEKSQAGIAWSISHHLKAGRLDSAFFSFLSICERSTQPIEKELRHAVNSLLYAFKRQEVYSVVSDIYQRTTQVLNDWQALRDRDNLTWLLDGATSVGSLKFCRSIISALAGMSDQQGLRIFTKTILDWSWSHASFVDTMGLFEVLGDLNVGEKNDAELRKMADELTQRAIREGSLNDAAQLMLWRARRESGQLCTPGQLRAVVSHLISSRQGQGSAVDLFLTAAPRYEAKLDISDCFRLREKSDTASYRLIEQLHTRCAFQYILDVDAGTDKTGDIGIRTLQLVDEAFTKVGKVNHAVEWLESLHERGRRSNRARLQANHASLLKRCWRTTRNIELTEQIFTKAQQLGLGPEAHDAYNVMIKAFVEAGNMDKASEYATQMIQPDNAIATATTIINLALGKAVTGDWAQIDRMMQDLDSRAKESSGTLQVEAHMFDGIYNQYRRQHTVDQLAEFVKKVVRLFHVGPSMNMLLGTTEAIMKAEDIDALEEWLHFVRQHDARAHLTSESITLLLFRIANRPDLKYEESLINASTLKRATEAPNPNEAADYLQRQLLEERERLSKMRRSQSEHRDMSQRDMQLALSQGDYDAVLQLYKKSLVNGLPASPISLNLALQAAFASEESTLEDVELMLHSARSAGFNVDRTADVFVLQRLKRKPVPEAEARNIALTHYENLEAGHRPISHYVTIAAARNLYLARKYDAALLLLQDVQASKWALKQPFDIKAYTMLLRIHIKQGSGPGVLTTMKAILDDNLRVDSQLINTLQNGRQLYGKSATKHGAAEMTNSAREAMFDLLEMCVADAKERLWGQRCKTLEFARQAVRLVELHEAARFDGEDA